MKNNQMQRELFNNMFGSNLYSASVTTGPLRGGHDADVALGEDECDAPALRAYKPSCGESLSLESNRRLNPTPFTHFSAYLHIGSEGFIRVLEAVPVLPSQSERYPRQAEGTVFGYFCIHCLRSGRVRHREVLVQQLLGNDVLKTGERWKSLRI